MMIGIVIATVILIVIGFILIRYSVKLPITTFFKVATFIIYAVAFKILGVSIHSLQVFEIPMKQYIIDKQLEKQGTVCVSFYLLIKVR